MLFLLFLTKFVYIVCSFVANIIFLYHDTDEWWYAHVINKAVLTGIIILGSSFTIYLYFYFYKMGMRLMNLLNL